MTLGEQIQLFPLRLRNASVVERWSVVPLLKPDNIAHHSFYVSIYAHSIARLIEWGGSYAMLLYLALTHDTDELVTGLGDILAPIKNEILDDDKAGAYIDRKMRQHLPGVYREQEKLFGDNGSFPGQNKAVQDAWKIIEAADKLDAMLFLIEDKKLGNTQLDDLICLCETNLHKAWWELPCRQQAREFTWENVMVPVIRGHTNTGGWGV